MKQKSLQIILEILIIVCGGGRGGGGVGCILSESVG